MSALAVPEEISDFTRQALATGYDYVIGISPAAALLPFAAEGEQAGGIAMASFNLAEGRYRHRSIEGLQAWSQAQHCLAWLYEHVLAPT